MYRGHDLELRLVDDCCPRVAIVVIWDESMLRWVELVTCDSESVQRLLPERENDFGLDRCDLIL